MLLLFFTHTHLTVTVTLGLLLIPKVKATTTCPTPFSHFSSRRLMHLTWLTLIHTERNWDETQMSTLDFASD